MFLTMVWKSPMTHDDAPRSSTDSDLDSGQSVRRTGRPEQLVTQPSGCRRRSFHVLPLLQALTSRHVFDDNAFEAKAKAKANAFRSQ